MLHPSDPTCNISQYLCDNKYIHVYCNIHVFQYNQDNVHVLKRDLKSCHLLYDLQTHVIRHYFRVSRDLPCCVVGTHIHVQESYSLQYCIQATKCYFCYL